MFAFPKGGLSSLRATCHLTLSFTDLMWAMLLAARRAMLQRSSLFWVGNRVLSAKLATTQQGRLCGQTWPVSVLRLGS